jgi:predicted nucleic acid-binding protein
MSCLKGGRKSNMENYSTFNDVPPEYTEYFIKEALKKRFVLDTSVITKWYYSKGEEDISNSNLLYNNLHSDNFIFFAPDLLIYEILNIYRSKHELNEEDINSIITELYDLITILGINKNTFSRSFATARRLNISFYDSVYLSLAEDIDAVLVTADKKLYGAAKHVFTNMMLLSEFIL